MGNWSVQQEAKKEVKEKERTSRETLGKFFYDLAKLVFTAMALVGGVSLDNCFTRLRVVVKDGSLIRDDLINTMKNSGIKKNGTDIQIVFGMQVPAVKSQVEDMLERM